MDHNGDQLMLPVGAISIRRRARQTSQPNLPYKTAVPRRGPPPFCFNALETTLRAEEAAIRADLRYGLMASRNNKKIPIRLTTAARRTTTSSRVTTSSDRRSFSVISVNAPPASITVASRAVHTHHTARTMVLPSLVSRPRVRRTASLVGPSAPYVHQARRPIEHRGLVPPCQ